MASEQSPSAPSETTTPTTPSTAAAAGGPPLAGTAAIVTGGGSGIGLACAAALARDGSSVLITGRTEERLRTGAAEIEAVAADGAVVRWQVADAKSEPDMAAAVATACEVTGGLDFAIANAGRGGLGPLVATPIEEWEDILATNLTGTFLIVKHAGAAIARSGGGSIVAISSIAAAVTHRFMGPYCVSKTAIDVLVREAADELGGAGVRVNSVRPGVVLTDLMVPVKDDETVFGSYTDNMPLGRAGEVEDVAPLVRFLLGPESSWVTGTSISVDGGHHLRRGPDFGHIARALYGDAACDGVPPIEG
jgi:NAD(P)-dependent dehydrogenase (short-subunit alcohol dehydrogenase family)